MDAILAEAKAYAEQAKAYAEQTQCYITEINELLGQLEEKKQWLQDFAAAEEEKREKAETLYREAGNISAHMREKFQELQAMVNGLSPAAGETE